MTTMFDAVVADNIPTYAQIAAGYVDGRYANYSAVVARTPLAQHVSITVTGKPDTMVADCETGDLTPSQAARWAQNELAATRHPTIYCSRSLWEANTSLWPKGVDFWVADWTGTPHLVPGSVATQYAANVAGCDLSLTNGVWPARPVPTPIPNPKPAGKEDEMLILETPTKTYLLIGSGKVYIPDTATGSALNNAGIAVAKVSDAFANTIPNA